MNESMAEEVNSSHLEQTEGHDEDCIERSEGTNCKGSGTTGTVLVSALDGGA
jgi:hypothetical protein